MYLCICFERNTPDLNSFLFFYITCYSLSTFSLFSRASHHLTDSRLQIISSIQCHNFRFASLAILLNLIFLTLRNLTKKFQPIVPNFHSLTKSKYTSELKCFCYLLKLVIVNSLLRISNYSHTACLVSWYETIA